MDLMQPEYYRQLNSSPNLSTTLLSVIKENKENNFDNMTQRFSKLYGDSPIPWEH